MKVVLSAVVFLALCLSGSADVTAHHSGSEYASTTVEIDGTLLEVAWQNPHVHDHRRGDLHVTARIETVVGMAPGRDGEAVQLHRTEGAELKVRVRPSEPGFVAQ